MIIHERLARPRWRIALAASAVVSVIGGGFWFATQFQSPAQQEADARAPAPGPVFAEVDRGSLVGEVGFVGEVGPSAKSPVTILPAPDASLSVVTGHPLEAGSAVSSGQALTEVNGRPVFGVQSPFAFYRDMGVGDRGPDVEVLQKALAARSYQVDPDGRFGSETARAVERWYGDSGYSAPTRTATADMESIDPVEDDAGQRGAVEAQTQGVYVPVAEVVAMPTVSAQIIQGLQVGQPVGVAGEADLVLGSADVVVTVTVPATDLGDVAQGDAATVTVDGVQVSGVVGEIRAVGSAGAAQDRSADGTGEDAAAELASAPEVTFTVAPDTQLSVKTGRARVTVTTQIVASDALIVPVLAVSDRGADKNILTKLQADGTLVEVLVIVLGTLEGEVAVEPVDTEALEVGDRVRVG